MSPELQQEFIDLATELSEDHLACNVDKHWVQLKERRSGLLNRWETLEIKVGRIVSLNEVLGWPVATSEAHADAD